MAQAKWYAGKVTHKTKATTEDVIKYLEDKGIPYRLRKVKNGWKVDMKVWN